MLRSALNTGVKRRLIPYNPAEHIELAPENPKRQKPWTPEQSQAFLLHIAQDRLANLYHLMLVTGMRRGETVGLRWEDVDLDGECLFVIQQITDVNGRSMVSTPKSKRGQRLVAIDAETVAMLRRQQETQNLERAWPWLPASTSRWSPSGWASQLAITADLYTHVNRGLGKAAAEQIARALRPASPAVPSAEPRKRIPGGW